MSKVDIEDFEQVNTITYSAIEIFVIGIVLGVNARLGVRIFGKDGKPVDSKQLTMEGEDYKNWGSDDDYVIDFVCKQLGFTRKPQETGSSTIPIVDTNSTDSSNTASSQ